MKQAALLGRTAGLRPAQTRRLERLSHRRHPEAFGADLLTLQRLAAESAELALPLTLVIDARGLCRLLWVGPLEQSGRLLERLPGEIAELEEAITEAEAQLADMGFYADDPQAWQAMADQLEKDKQARAEKEEAWLALELKREALEKG